MTMATLAVAGALPLLGCGEPDVAAPPTASPPALAAPSPHADPEPVVVEQRFLDDPWPRTSDGFEFGRRYDEAAFEATCTAAGGHTDDAAAGALRCRIASSRTIEHATVRDRCSWEVTEHVPLRDASDARLTEVFDELRRMERTLVERGVEASERAVADRPHLELRGEEACWAQFLAGDFACLRSGEADLRLQTNIGLVRYRVTAGRREILEDETESLGMDVWREVGADSVAIRRDRIVRCSG